jgi:hypothetical protein
LVAEGDVVTDTPAFYEERIRLLEAEQGRLRDALGNVSIRTDGDGKPCWCHDEMRSGLFALEHEKWCLAARAALDGSPSEDTE